MEIALQSTPFFQAVEYLAIFSCGMAGGTDGGTQAL